ncbi:MAG: hypothetical protein IH933_01070 [Euryarchaeota archaeon]|jgi:hypothetical protein|nr:hypothetical protein [Euryarchaeota archaeon]
MARSRGDPRVLFVINFLLSAAFCYIVLQGLVFIGATEFSLTMFAGGTIVLMVLTHLVTR